MKINLATFTILMLSSVGVAQALSSTSPFSWNEARGARGMTVRVARDDVAWRSVSDDDRSAARGYAAAKQKYDEETGPFTEDEAKDMRSAWSKIREAKNFDDINWHSVGLSHAPGDREARDFMAKHWDSLRRAERFDDINWRAEYKD